MSEKRSPRSQEQTLLGALVQDTAHTTDGSLSSFAARTGLSRQGLTALVKGEPLQRSYTGELSSLLGYSVDELKKLGSISVREACNLIVTAPGTLESKLPEMIGLVTHLGEVSSPVDTSGASVVIHIHVSSPTQPSA